MATTSAPDWFDRACSRFFGVFWQVALIAGLWFGLIRFPSAPTLGVDSSWQMVLGYAASHRLQFGTDIVFTYGPLGYLMNATNLGEHAGQHFAWQLIVNLIFAVVVFLLGRGLTGWRRVVFYVFFFAYGTAYLDVAHMIIILILGLALVRERVLSRPWLGGAVALLLALLALIKFTNLVLAGVSLVWALGYYAWRRRWNNLAIVGGTGVIGFLAGWEIVGQRLGNLPAYISNSIEISSGYNGAMGVQESSLMFATGIVTVTTLGAYLLLTLWRRTDPMRAVAFVLIALTASFINWKHGFVRADGHVSAHFYLCLFYACSFPVLLQDDGPLRRLKGSLLVICATACLSGVWQNLLPWITNPLAFYNLRVMENLHAVADAGNFAAKAQEQFTAVQKGQQLGSLKQIVGGKTVDVVGNEQAYVFLNQLNYHPRPVFQSYSAYTPRLAELNEQFYASPQAPEFALTSLNTIDNRLPLLDDAPTRRYILHHYSLAGQEGPFLVWKRQPHQPELDRRQPLLEKIVAIGEKFSVPPARDDEPIWCEVDLRPSLLGRLRALFYKPPEVRMLVADGDNFRTSYRFVPAMGRSGFLLHPYLASNFSLSRYAEGGHGETIQQIAVEMEKADRRYFQPAIRLKLFRLAPFPRTVPAGSDTPEKRFRVFSQPPAVVNALFPPEIIPEGDKEVLLTHPPSELEFHVGPNVRRLSGHFGLVANAYTNGHTTDGAEFFVEWIDANGKKTELFHHHLRPLELPQDRGEHSFDLPAPAGGGRMILRIGPGPAGNISFDWTYWTDVKLSN